ncbi:hypothetical protein BTVI_125819 [Pitangus sulphuratus]|nr:hypothetical protein BTVI_125819 [Pitangus sulphuratus]
MLLKQGSKFVVANEAEIARLESLVCDVTAVPELEHHPVGKVGVDDYSSESDVIIIPSALDFVSQDEMLTPLGRLDKYAASENIFNRQMVARSLLDTLKEVSDDERDCIAVLERISRLADDSDPFGKTVVKVREAAGIDKQDENTIESQNGLAWKGPAMDRDIFHKTMLFKAPSNLIQR